MCGIAGLVDLNRLSASDGEAVAEMVRVLRHRGPDDFDTWRDDACALGHSRLSIIDLASGRQPLSNEDGSVWIAFNGEIYDFDRLRRGLESRGHRFRTRTDTETIVHLYEEEGERCVERLRGMFAFTIWDARRRRLFLARDRLGIKPLYYTAGGGRFAFGSELKALLQAPGVEPEVDRRSLLDYLTLHWIPAPRTIFENVFKLPAGHTLTFDERGARLSRYWDVPFPDADEERAIDGAVREEELVDEFRERLRDSVRTRLVADVPVGAFLSGGIDSGAVVACMAELHGSGAGPAVLTNTIGFEERAFDESDHAARVANRFGTEHRQRVVRPDALASLERLAWHYDEPFADASAIPTCEVSRMARDAVTVALSGDGGDENLAGYRTYRLLAAQHRLRNLARPGRPALRWLGEVCPKADWLPRALRPKSTLQQLAMDEAEAIYHARAAVHPDLARLLLRDDVLADVRDHDPGETFAAHHRAVRHASPLHRQLYVDLKTYLVDDILVKVDRASMATGLEVRVPLLDHHLVEWLARVPARYKLRGSTGKYLFRQAYRPVLGTEIVDRRKQGFRVPLDAWFRGVLRRPFEERLLHETPTVARWLDVDSLRRLWSAHQKRRRNLGSVFWSVLMLEQWARTFVEASGKHPGWSNGNRKLARVSGPESPATVACASNQPGC